MSGMTPLEQRQAEHKHKVLVTGATGFVGRQVVKALQQQGHSVIATSRNGADVSGATGLSMDATKADSVQQAIEQTQPSAVVHLVGIIEETGEQTFERVHVTGSQNVLEAINKLSPKARYLHMSALGADPNSDSNYSRTKGVAEQLVKASGLDWTIFRPSLIFGVGDDFFGRVLKELVSSAPIVPQIGDGSFPFRPISVQDVAQAFAIALQTPQSSDQSYDLTGPQEFTLRELLQQELTALGKQKPLVSVPLPLMDLMVPMMQLLPNPPITTDQYRMLKAGNTAPNEPAASTFGLSMHPLSSQLAEIVRTCRP